MTRKNDGKSGAEQKKQGQPGKKFGGGSGSDTQRQQGTGGVTRQVDKQGSPPVTESGAEKSKQGQPGLKPPTGSGTDSQRQQGTGGVAAQVAQQAAAGRHGGGNGGGGGGRHPLTHQQQSAFDLIKHTLQEWGLGSLYNDAKSFIQQGLSSDEIKLKLADTQEWKQRFAGNEIRQKAGLRVLSPAEYLAVEEQYHQTLRAYGIPRGFYDNKHATDAWIGGDVSPSELQARVQRVSEAIDANPTVIQAWNKYYGGGKGGLIAAGLDMKKAAPLVDQQIVSAEIGSAALDQGLNVARGRAEQLSKYGVTLSSARQAYSQIASRLPTDQSVAARFGTSFGQGQEEDATLLGNAAAQNKQANLYAMEGAQFSGHGAASDASNNSGAGAAY